MKHIILLSVILIILSGCVSNQAFKEQQQRLQTLEAELAQNSEELVVLRKDIMQSRRHPGGVPESADIEQINQQLLQNEEDMKAIIQEQMELSNSLNVLTQTVEVSDQAIVDMIRDLQTRINVFSSEGLSPEEAAAMAAASGSSSDLQQKINRMSGELDDIRSELDTVKHKLANMPAESTLTTSVPQQDADDKAAYEAARDEYYNKNFQTGISKLEQFVTQYPNSDYAGNAIYWKGECYYAMGNMSSALREFQHTISRYPKSWKVADAQLKIGMTYMNMGDYAAAKSELNKLKADYPQYSRMDLVNRYLNELQ
jgi:tol-pal system protein YbgF